MPWEIKVINSSFLAFSCPQVVSFFEKKKDTYEANQTYCNRGIDTIMDGILVFFLLAMSLFDNINKD